MVGWVYDLQGTGEHFHSARKPSNSSAALDVNLTVRHPLVAVNRLQTVMQEAGAAMYQQPGGPTAGPGGPDGPTGSTGQAGDEDVIEGEFS